MMTQTFITVSAKAQNWASLHLYSITIYSHYLSDTST